MPSTRARESPRTTIGILQPCYLPWLGYFEQLAVADRFVLLDDVQYTKQDWRNRNRIKTTAGSEWLTVPVRRCPLDTPLGEIEVNYDMRWQRKHLLTIEQNYRKAPYFQPLFDEMRPILEAGLRKLVDLDRRLIEVLCSHLAIDTPISWASQITRHADPEDTNGRLLEICRQHEATVFYEGASGASYLDVGRFERAGVEVVFQDYSHPEYPQLYGEFLPHQSAIDLVMNTGPEAARILRSSPAPLGTAASAGDGPGTGNTCPTGSSHA
ncbi:MAG: WbqC family protein [bacterium]|nr:WbqC family protein [bacterium]